MKLDEILQICLLALQSQYAECVIEGNAAVLREIAPGSEAVSATEMLATLQDKAPHLLQAPARMVIDEQKSEISLLDRSEDVPAFRIYCGGHSPHQREKQCHSV